jgi:3-dehydrosphinganine reductase
MRYSNAASLYSVHIAFPSNFISPSFISEQKTKPQLTKQIEGTSAHLSELTNKLHNAKQVADAIIVAVDKGEFVICTELEASLLFGGMVGVSPRRGFGIVDSILVLLSGIFWPLLRWWCDWMVTKDKSHLDQGGIE